MSEGAPEPRLALVPSEVQGGNRVRAVKGRLHVRPANETFHDFLINYIKWTFGEQWWKSQTGVPAEQRHVVFQWTHDDYDSKRAHEEDGGPPLGEPHHEQDAIGSSWALLSLGYDLFCVAAAQGIPDYLADRLRNRQYFQGARYELAVAALLLRSGFSLEWLDADAGDEVRCEFIARLGSDGATVAVEAKSRRRAGVIHQPGEFTYEGDVTGLLKQIRQGEKKKPDDIPLLVFVDVNLPPSPDVPPQDRQWYSDLTAALARLRTATPDQPDVFGALVVTNFSSHHQGASGLAAQDEWIIVDPKHSEHPVPSDARAAIEWGLSRHDFIPSEV